MNVGLGLFKIFFCNCTCLIEIGYLSLRLMYQKLRLSIWKISKFRIPELSSEGSRSMADRPFWFFFCILSVNVQINRNLSACQKEKNTDFFS